jgi:hypothetical protein
VIIGIAEIHTIVSSVRHNVRQNGCTKKVTDALVLGRNRTLYVIKTGLFHSPSLRRGENSSMGSELILESRKYNPLSFRIMEYQADLKKSEILSAIYSSCSEDNSGKRGRLRT